MEAAGTGIKKQIISFLNNEILMKNTPLSSTGNKDKYVRVSYYSTKSNLYVSRICKYNPLITVEIYNSNTVVVYPTRRSVWKPLRSSGS